MPFIIFLFVMYQARGWDVCNLITLVKNCNPFHFYGLPGKIPFRGKVMTFRTNSHTSYQHVTKTGAQPYQGLQLL